jgi:hypothetical protein
MVSGGIDDFARQAVAEARACTIAGIEELALSMMDTLDD